MGAIKSIAPKFGGFLPRQMRRALIGCISCLVIVIYLSVAGAFTDSKSELPQSLVPTMEKFPRKIWQTWKVDPLDFEKRDLDTAKSWVSKNPEYRYEVLTDQNDMYYVETHFGPEGFNRPDIVETYRALTAKIIKADLLRYLVMYVDGGVYTDIDVEAIRPIKRFIPERYNERDINMVVSVEIDEPSFSEHAILGQKSQSFCQWTFMCKPKLPVMMRLVDNILKWLNGVAKKQGKPISEIVLDFDEVISGTGPSAFTSAILQEMSASAGEPVTWKSFHDMHESKLVGGFLVLTVEAFAAGQGHSDSGNHNARAALVKHHYHASEWPKNHPRFNHPVYGEVEKCNWDRGCVEEWDKNTAAFKELTPEEQAKKIALAKLEIDNPPPKVPEVPKWNQDGVSEESGEQTKDQAPLPEAPQQPPTQNQPPLQDNTQQQPTQEQPVLTNPPQQQPPQQQPPPQQPPPPPQQQPQQPGQQQQPQQPGQQQQPQPGQQQQPQQPNVPAANPIETPNLPGGQNEQPKVRQNEANKAPGVQKETQPPLVPQTTPDGPEKLEDKEIADLDNELNNLEGSENHKRAPKPALP
ncbi:hypothetical protein FQN49_003089 [Arthroderma sp. PD_2]|nr:hypothetical protein FQN49_003089 [Arthroderma sp. PD_2]